MIEVHWHILITIFLSGVAVGVATAAIYIDLQRSQS